MSNTSKLGACPTQFANHLGRLKGLLQAITPCLKDASHQDGQLLFQMLITRLHTYMEAYYRCMVNLGTFWAPEPVRTYLSSKKAEQADNIVGLPVAALGKWAEREVAFGDGAEGLKGIITALRLVTVSRLTLRGQVPRSGYCPQCCSSSTWIGWGD